MEGLIIIKTKHFKTLFILPMIMLIFLSSNAQAFASTDFYQVQKETRASKYIAAYTIGIKNSSEGGGKLLVTAFLETSGYVSVLEIRSLELQESYDGVKWTTVQTWSDKTTNLDYSSISKSYLGKIGYMYRAVSTCYAEKNGDSETKTYTSGIAYAAK